jgi:hypothetical protein
VALTLRTSPGPEGSKDKQALAGARGVAYRQFLLAADVGGFI